MRVVQVDRWYRGSEATLSRWHIHGVKHFWCYGFEPPWKDNKRNISCIPAGAYVMKLDTFQGKYPNYRLENVPGRTDIEIHSGNTIEDTAGCLLPGYEIGTLDNNLAVLQSTKARLDFMAFMHGYPTATIVIKDV